MPVSETDSIRTSIILHKDIVEALSQKLGDETVSYTIRYWLARAAGLSDREAHKSARMIRGRKIIHLPFPANGTKE